jgi:hypothetical protein
MDPNQMRVNQELGYKLEKDCSSMTVNPKQIKGPAATHCGAPPRSATIIDQTLKLSKRNRKK